jgi:hypothetical protein
MLRCQIFKMFSRYNCHNLPLSSLDVAS